MSPGSIFRRPGSRWPGRYFLAPVTVFAAGCLANDGSPQVASVNFSSSSEIHFAAIGDTLRLAVTATDANGAVVPPGDLWFGSRDSSVVVVEAGGLIRSIGDGATRVVVNGGGEAWDSIAVSVSQARDSLVATVLSDGPVVSVAEGAPLPLTCRSFDSAGYLLALPIHVTSAAQRVSGTDCGALLARHSGYDTLTIVAGGYTAVVPVIVAVRPVVTSDPTARLPVDSLPAGVEPWAPTLISRPGGGLDLYFAGYVDATYPLNGVRGDLERLVSADGVAFEYDGVALKRDRAACTLQDTGIENVAILPRAEGGGWRMYFAAGGCFGWQVFSATSSDQSIWSREPGIRVSNGGNVPPDDPVTPPWPAGEGMAIDQRNDGSWRMLVGAYEQVAPREDRFQIVEWTSPDQLSWSYVGPVLTTRQVGPAANRSVYSPSIQVLAPGLLRLFFAGDNLDAAGGQSRIYTAVSTDGRSWQVEGVLLERAGVNFSYSSFADGRLAFIRTTGTGPHELGLVGILSP